MAYVVCTLCSMDMKYVDKSALIEDTNIIHKQEAVNALADGIDQLNRYRDTLTEDNLKNEIFYSRDAQPSSVLVVLRFNKKAASSKDCWDVLLTLRPNHMRSHGGLVCLPGGKLEPGESPVDGALREAQVLTEVYRHRYVKFLACVILKSFIPRQLSGFSPFCFSLRKRWP